MICELRFPRLVSKPWSIPLNSCPTESTRRPLVHTIYGRSSVTHGVPARFWSVPFSPSNGSRSMSSLPAVQSNNANDDNTVPLNLTAGDITTKIHVKPSYIHKPKAVENLLKNLPALLTDATMPATEIKNFSTKGWDLDEASDTIHRYVTVKPDEISRIMEEIKAASQASNHDPHIYIDGSRMTISCTTHVPPGLSMKDVKLAKLIDKILDSCDVDFGHSNDLSEADILTYRQRGRENNMGAVRKAKLACSCG